MIESGESGSTLKNKTVVPHWETQRDGDQDGREEAVESAQDVLPHWDNDLRRLMFRGKIIKLFRNPSKNQERVLRAFDKDQWPVRMDDPLPADDVPAKIRLHDTIKSLNRHQRTEGLLRFHGDGTGEGILWEALRDGDQDGREEAVESAQDVLPHWDNDLRRLMFRGKILKLFKLPAPNQEHILNAFQETGWMTKIDNPLPSEKGQDSKIRLRETIKSLNRNQRTEGLLRFHGDGNGKGILWEDTSQRPHDFPSQPTED